jgi:hypothetical protein
LTEGLLMGDPIVCGNPHVEPGTRPGILPWNGNQADPHGIHLHIPRCSPKVTLVENANPSGEALIRV